MNDIIKTFEAQCTDTVEIYNDVTGITHEREFFDKERFAKLIVAKVLDEVSSRAYVSGDRAWSDDVDRPWIELEFGYGKLHDAKTFRS